MYAEVGFRSIDNVHSEIRNQDKWQCFAKITIQLFHLAMYPNQDSN